MKSSRYHRLPALLILLLLMLLVTALPGVAAGQTATIDVGPSTATSAGVYTNPLHIQIPGDGLMGSCADPSIIYGQDHYWYIYCTTDPLNDQDHDPNGSYHFHLIPMLRSYDLVNWTYMGDAFSARPPWVASDAGLWAPDIRYFNNQYYLYYTASNTSLPGGGSAIGVATGPTPLGPWTDSGAPVVEPGATGWVFDPYVLVTDTTKYIYFGSYFGGIWARQLSPDGLHSDPATQTQVTIDNRYEGTYIYKHGGYYYLFGSATNCCNGPLTGYSVFVGRSTDPLGPYIDRDGHSLLEPRVGGTVVISMNGNEWVGPGHNAVFTDFSGQDWFVYHAVNRYDPYFAAAVGFTKRPVLMDPLDWVDGWPTVRGGLWASDTPQPAPAAQPGWTTDYEMRTDQPDIPGQQIDQLSDEFNGTTLSPQWSWVRQPAPGTYGVGGGTFRFDTQAADLYVDSNNASVLTEPAPNGNYVVETKVRLNLPPEGCCFNYVQAGLVIYGDDDNFIKLSEVSIWNTRQTEFAKELKPVPDGYPRYGNTVAGPPGGGADYIETYLRIVKTTHAGEENYRSYTSPDGVHWDRAGVWTHNLGTGSRIGLVSMGGSGFTANFDYVHVYTLKH